MVKFRKKLKRKSKIKNNIACKNISEIAAAKGDKMRVDFHSHILPNMDDGAENVDMSIKMLKMLIRSGVEKVVLTPHFYRRKEDINSFLKRREEAFRILSEETKSLPDCPEMILGAEVYFYPSLSSDEDFGRLCIGDSCYVLVELPFEQFHDNFFRSYAKFMNNCEQKILLAHIERYFSFGNNIGDFIRLSEYGDALWQMNCSSISEAGVFRRKPLLDMISREMISALGTDAHDVSHRPPMFDKAEKIIANKCGRDAFDNICRRSEMILNERQLAKLS